MLSISISNTCLATVITINEGSFNGTNVGLIDRLVEQADKVNGEDAELQWVMDALGITDSSIISLNKTEGAPYFSTNIDNVFAFDATPASDYFLIKNSQRIALFENREDRDWGVFNVDELIGQFNLATDQFIISHVSRFDAPSLPPPITSGETTIPEPNTLALLGLGILGFRFIKKDKIHA